MEYALLALSWAIFYSLHSFLAATKLKRILTRKLGKAFNWYRFFYSLFSTLFFIGILVQSLYIPYEVLMNQAAFTTYLGYLIASLGTIVVVKASKQISLSSFLGLKPSSEFSTEKLVVQGWYARVRHPLYAGLILIFGGYFLIAGSYSAAVHLGCLLIYLPFGIYFEEQNLISLYGNQYRDYRKKVPAIIPLFWESKKRLSQNSNERPEN
jgi:protein-S-isoprenylcysteine O-methyltransferase Ste14